jgi:DNA-binding transcriptional regulator YhcF (GntR family)
MFESINIHSSVAVYVQIENTVQFAVASGRLKADDQLPSVREASEKLNVNPNTV